MINNKITNLRKRHFKEKIFRSLGAASIFFALSFLALLFLLIFSRGTSAFWQSQLSLKVDLTNYSANNFDHRLAVKQALKARFPEAKTANEINSLYQIISKIGNLELKKKIKNNPDLIGKESKIWFSFSSKADMYIKNENPSGLNNMQLSWINNLKFNKETRQKFNFNFFHFADSREAEIAGVGAGLMGSFMVMIVFLIFAFPIGVMCSFYLEEFAPKNLLTDIIEISINNLAAIPSIIYGLLGLTVYLQIMHLPRSSSIVGGMTLFMLVLPVIIIATRNTIRSIPQTIRDGAEALGASKLQVTLHHLLPLSVPGIMTGTILAISRALGETAPLLMIGMVAFIADVPSGFTDPTTVLPVQIYLWSDSPEAGFAEKTAAAIMILLFFLIILNLIAVLIRKKFERKW